MTLYFFNTGEDMGGFWDSRSKTKTCGCWAKATVCKPIQLERSNRLWCPPEWVLVLMNPKARLAGKQLRKQQCASMMQMASQVEAQLPGSRIPTEAPLTWSTSKHLQNMFFLLINRIHWSGLSSCFSHLLFSRPLSYLHALHDSKNPWYIHEVW